MKTIKRNSLQKGDEVIVRCSSGQHTVTFAQAQITSVKENAVYTNDSRLKSVKMEWVNNYGGEGGCYKYSRGYYENFKLVTEDEKNQEIQEREEVKNKQLTESKIKVRMEKSIRRLDLSQLQAIDDLLTSFNIEGL